MRSIGPSVHRGSSGSSSWWVAPSCGCSIASFGGGCLLGFVARDLQIDRPISEWQPVNMLDGSFPAFKLALVALIPTLFNAGSWRRWQVPLATLAALFAVQHQRHIPLFGIVAAPLLAE